MSISDTEMIAHQAKQIANLEVGMADLMERIRRARLHIYCVGGPLNDNRLAYSKDQLVTFYRIADELEGGINSPG